VRLEASIEPHVHQKFDIFWINIASTMTCLNFKKAWKMAYSPLRVNSSIMNPNLVGKLPSITITSKKVSKNLQTYCIHNTMPKNAKCHFGCFCPLAFKQHKNFKNYHIMVSHFKSIPTNFTQELSIFWLWSSLEQILNFWFQNLYQENNYKNHRFNYTDMV
jgi:hypothetical protein